RSVHRLIKAKLRNHQPTLVDSQWLEQLQETLRNGRQGVAEMEQWLKCQYAQQLKGQSFSGRIVQVNAAGVQVRLDDNGLEGFLNLAESGEKLSFGPLYLEHLNEQTRFCLEQLLQVIGSDVDMKRRQIQLKLATPAAQD